MAINIPRPRSNDLEVQRFYDAVRAALSGVSDPNNSIYADINSRMNVVRDQIISAQKTVADVKATVAEVSEVVVKEIDRCASAITPSTPTNTATDSDFGVMHIFWSTPTYTGYSGTEVWVSDTNDIATAEMVAVAAGGKFSYPVTPIESSTVTNPDGSTSVVVGKDLGDGNISYDITRYFWLRNLSDCPNIGKGAFSQMIECVMPPTPAILGAILGGNAVDLLTKLGLDSTVAFVESAKDKFAVQTDNNGFVQGFGLLNTGEPLTSGMVFNVSNFYITNLQPSEIATYNALRESGDIAGASALLAGGKKTPFMVASDGKVYVKDLFVEGANITNIDASKITTGTLDASQVTITNLTVGNVSGAMANNGAWVSSKTYTAGSVVTYNGSSYVANQSSTGVLPTESGYWDVLAGKGVSYDVTIFSTNGDVFKQGSSESTTLYARVYSNGVDITDTISEVGFKWTRKSLVDPEPPYSDANWNALYTSGYKQVSITTEEVENKATFFCEVTIA